MSEGGKVSLRARVLKGSLFFVHATHRVFVTFAFGLMFAIAEGWTQAFLIFAWLLYVVDGALAELANREHRQRQMRGQIHVAPNVVINEDQAERIFAIFQEGSQPTGGRPN